MCAFSKLIIVKMEEYSVYFIKNCEKTRGTSRTKNEGATTASIKLTQKCGTKTKSYTRAFNFKPVHHKS